MRKMIFPLELLRIIAGYLPAKLLVYKNGTSYDYSEALTERELTESISYKEIIIYCSNRINILSRFNARKVTIADTVKNLEITTDHVEHLSLMCDSKQHIRGLCDEIILKFSNLHMCDITRAYCRTMEEPISKWYRDPFHCLCSEYTRIHGINIQVNVYSHNKLCRSYHVCGKDIVITLFSPTVTMEELKELIDRKLKLHIKGILNIDLINKNLCLGGIPPDTFLEKVEGLAFSGLNHNNYKGTKYILKKCKNVKLYYPDGRFYAFSFVSKLLQYTELILDLSYIGYREIASIEDSVLNRLEKTTLLNTKFGSVYEWDFPHLSYSLTRLGEWKHKLQTIAIDFKCDIRDLWLNAGNKICNDKVTADIYRTLQVMYKMCRRINPMEFEGTIILRTIEDEDIQKFISRTKHARLVAEVTNRMRLQRLVYLKILHRRGRIQTIPSNIYINRDDSYTIKATGIDIPCIIRDILAAA